MTSKTIGSKADQQAVLGVLKGVYEAWEANDAEAFVADYLDDTSVVQPGVYLENQQESRPPWRVRSRAHSRDRA